MQQGRTRLLTLPAILQKLLNRMAIDKLIIPTRNLKRNFQISIESIFDSIQ